jgi:hypothetical protein
VSSPASPSPSTSWGRVDENGTVFCRTSTGEREVGQWPGGDPEEVLAHFARKYDALVLEIELLEQRVRSGNLSPDDAAGRLKQVRTSVAEAQVVGDLDALEQRLGALGELLVAARDKRKAERARKLVEARAK